MKKILIVIHDMRLGGAQRSLLSFLNATADQYDDRQITLMVIDPAGEFYSRIPAHIQKRPAPRPLRWLGSRLSGKLIFGQFSWVGIRGEVSWLKRKRKNDFPRDLNLQQKLWHSWRQRIPEDQTQYDVAVAYMDGVPSYYVAEKIRAKKKVLWIHSEYQKQGYHREFDRPYFQKADQIVTISPNCRDCIVEEFPEFSEKTQVLENIVLPEEIWQKSKTGGCDAFADTDKLKLLTVARLNRQKGIDLAVEAAEKLASDGVDFLWLVIGTGPEREALQQLIDQKGLTHSFRLLGGMDNPYGYMASCHILVQPSRVEGKSIVLDEAKILCKPIVAAAYTTVTDSVTHGQTGWVVEMTPAGIAGGIQKLWQAAALRQQLAQNLRSLPKGNPEELKKYEQIML